MKKPSLVLLLLAGAALLFADDGSWGDSRGFTPSVGDLYSLQGNPDIVLDKEYLELSDYRTGRTRAVFLFANTSKAAVTVECAFPVLLEFLVDQIALDLTMQPTESRGPTDQEGWDFGGTGNYAPQAQGPYRTNAGDWFQALGVHVQLWEPQERDWGGRFIPASTYPKGRRDFPAAEFKDKLSLSIRQDGREVPITACVADLGTGPEKITLHFRHRLTFASGASSEVEVVYESPAGAKAFGGPDVAGHINLFEWNYILATGASWKGPIGSLVLALPPDFNGEIPAELKPMGSFGGRLLYQARAWEPKSTQDLDLSWSETSISSEEAKPVWLSTPQEISLKNATRAKEGVRALGASSFLKDKADIFVPAGVIRQAPFDAARLFDGIRETCWVEGTTDDGIGEYVRFALDAPMNVVAVQNGFLRSTIDVPEKATWSYFEKNNRVKTLEIRKESGEKAAILNLADIRDLQYFTVALAPGNYRAAIAAVYPGTKWKDTCLGELSFFPGVTVDLSPLAKDKFFGRFVTQ
jgi:hypothetical protein